MQLGDPARPRRGPCKLVGVIRKTVVVDGMDPVWLEVGSDKEVWCANAVREDRDTGRHAHSQHPAKPKSCACVKGTPTDTAQSAAFLSLPLGASR